MWQVAAAMRHGLFARAVTTARAYSRPACAAMSVAGIVASGGDAPGKLLRPASSLVDGVGVKLDLKLSASKR
jgi:hypothetical protein